MDRNFIGRLLKCYFVMSLSARRAWIEIITRGGSKYILLMSLSARRAWIEITTYFDTSSMDDVALRKESVDRNFCVVSLNYKEVLSLSARRAWIEI